MSKKIISLVTIMVFIFVTPCLASSSNYLYDLETGETEIVQNTYDKVELSEEIPFSNENINKFDELLIWTYEELLRYDQSSAYVDYKMKEVGDHIIYNNSPNNTQGQFVADYSGSWSRSATVSGTTSAELNLMVAKAGVAISGGCTNTRSWTKGNSYGTSVTIMPYQRISIAGYIPGVSTNGQAVYAVINGGNGDIVGYKYYPRGALVPSQTKFYTEVSQLWLSM